MERQYKRCNRNERRYRYKHVMFFRYFHGENNWGYDETHDMPWIEFPFAGIAFRERAINTPNRVRGQGADGL